jgi:hypothetical protein
MDKVSPQGVVTSADRVAPRIPPTLTFEQRKKKLIAEAERCRAKLDESKDIIRDNLKIDRLAKNGVSYLTTAASSAVDNMFNINAIRNGSLGRLLPVAASVYSIITRRKLVMPILRGGLVVAGVAAALFYMSRKKRARRVQANEIVDV